VANPAHLEKLCEGAKAWNAWRNSDPDIAPELSHIRLTLHQRQLGPSNGGPINLHSADLDRAYLPYATLTGADLSDARLIGADLTHARLDRAKLTGANLSDAILDQADLTGAELGHAILFGADLSNTRNLTTAQLEYAYGDASTKLPATVAPPQSWIPVLNDYDEDDYSGWDTEAPPEQNLYEILGLTLGAGNDEIRSAYRNLVKKLHPDLNPNDEEAQERFKRVSIAYKILSDPAQRQRYDRGEIDGDGRVSPEFEARRHFRRTTFRYFGAAVASFLLAAGALAAVWYTVLSTEPRGAGPQLAASQPKTSERLAAAPSPAKAGNDEHVPSLLGEGTHSAEPESRVAALIENERQPGAPAETARQAAPNIEAPATNSEPAQLENRAGAAALVGKVAPESQGAAVPAATALRPGKVDNSNGVPQQPAAPAVLPSTAAEEMLRPLFELHKGSAGQTATLAPDRGSVAALPQGGPERKGGRGGAETSVSPRGKLWQVWQEPTARDVGSQVLRDRAIRHALSTKEQSLTASDADGLQERRAGLSADGPTNALPSPTRQSRSAPLRRAEATPGRKPRSSRVAARPQSLARSASASFDEGAAQSEVHQQAVSDVLAGGF
jgi:curved DNA-binding protein CbpA